MTDPEAPSRAGAACLVGGAIARAIVPNDAFSAMTGWQSWLLSIVLGLAGALLGSWIFAGLFGLGDDDTFDWVGSSGPSSAP